MSRRIKKNNSQVEKKHEMKEEKKEKEVKVQSESMFVPVSHLTEVQKLLDNLRLRDEELLKEKKEQEHYQEVKSVVDHKHDGNGNFSFKLRFWYEKETEWVADKDCSCEALIQKYLSSEKLTKIRTAYLFCRVSSKQQKGPTHVSLVAQESALQKVVANLHLKDEEVLRVKVVYLQASAYNGIPSHLKDIAEVSRSKDLILIYRVDRLSRNIVRYLQLLEDMNDKGVLIYAVDENIWYHNRKLDFIRGILDANCEAVIIGKRVKMSVEQRRKRGDHIGSAPFGSRLVRDSSHSLKLEPHIQEQQIIKLIRKGSTFEELNKKGLYKRGKPWTKNMVSYVYKKSKK